MQTKSASSKRLYFYQNDPNGAPVRLRDANGEIVWEVHYGVTGQVDNVGTERIEQPIRLQGQYEDDESRLRYNRHRYFDPQTRIFVSQDPIGLAGGLHPYQFGPNTSGWIDPLGLTELAAFDPLPDGTQVFGLGDSHARLIHPDGPNGHNANKGNLMQVFKCGGGG